LPLFDQGEDSHGCDGHGHVCDAEKARHVGRAHVFHVAEPESLVEAESLIEDKLTIARDRDGQRGYAEAPFERGSKTSDLAALRSCGCLTLREPKPLHWQANHPCCGSAGQILEQATSSEWIRHGSLLSLL